MHVWHWDDSSCSNKVGRSVFCLSVVRSFVPVSVERGTREGRVGGQGL